MIVTGISEVLAPGKKSGAKLKIYIDNEFAFVLYKGELKTYHICENKVISDSVYDSIMHELLPKRAKLRCMNLLKSRDYTEYQLRTKLKEGLYPESVIDEAICYVESYGYVDDLRYAKSYIYYAGSSKSVRKIETELIAKGITKKIIDKAYQECEESNDLVDEEHIIENYLVKKKYDSENATEEERRKIIGFLYRKGFPLDKIYKVVGKSN